MPGIDVVRARLRGAVPIATALVATALLVGCAGGPDAAAGDPSPSPIATVTWTGMTLSPDEVASMTIADVLRSEPRFSRFREIAERVETPIAESGLAVWDWPAERMGDNRDGVTVFVPIDAAFEALDPAILAVLEDPDADGDNFYGLVGHHYVHRLYPSEAFEAGDQRTWRRSLSGPVQLSLSPLTWGGHRIVETDIRAANGIIHLIDGVVVPDAVLEAAGSGA